MTNGINLEPLGLNKLGELSIQQACQTAMPGAYHVKATKISSKNNVSPIKDSHIVYGYTYEKVKQNVPFCLVRYKTGDREAYGHFITSKVLTVTEKSERLTEIETLNSVYEIELLD